MNICDLAKEMEDGQTAYSCNLKTRIIKKNYGLYEFDGEDQPNNLLIDCNMNYLLEDDWEIELPFVDFWTAYTTARNEGWPIMYEDGEVPYVYNQPRCFTLDELNGRWQILK